MSWGNIMKLFHIAFFFSKFKPNSNWELMLSPVIRTILLLSLEFRNTDWVSTGQQLVNVIQCIYMQKTTVVNSAVQANRICRFFSRFLIFDLLGVYNMIPGLIFALDARSLGFSHNAIGPPHLTAFVSFWHFSYLENIHKE